jgi:putative ABC transport system permease protein
MKALNRKLARDLWHLRGQLFAVAAVAMCGIAAFVTMRSAYTALVDGQADYYRRYRFADVFAHAKRAPESLAARIRELPGVAAVQTRVMAEVSLDVPGLPEPATGRLISIPERRTPILNDLHLRRGRWIEPASPGEAIVSEAFADANRLEVGTRIGAVINGRRQELTVVGVALSPEYVYEIRGLEVFPDNRRFGVLWLGREALAGLFDLEGAFNDVSISLAPGAAEAPVIAGVDGLLARYGGLGAYGRDLQLSHRFLSDEIAQDRVSGLYLPTIFLAVAAFLVHVVLSRLVGSQRDQVAVLKAFGYGDAAIGAHYLGIALAAVLAGAVPGTLLGIWFAAYLADLYARFFHFPELLFAISPGLIGLAAAVSAAAATIGAVSAVRRAVRLPPAEAMRPEPPPAFQRGLFERTGAAGLLSPPARMIVRNLARRRVKALLSTTGIALAVGMLVLTRFFGDCVDWMVRIQFREAQREDVTVILREARASAALHDLRHLPGVLAAEPFRAVAARLVAGHRARRIDLMGVASGGELRRLVTRNLARVEIPPEGLVLTDALAALLGVAPGDPVTVEVLEGKRGVRETRVAATVDDLFGLTATMDIRALNRLLGEGPTVSGAFLAADPARLDELTAELKRTPDVAGVAVRESMLASFYDTIAQSMLATTTVLVAFACVIALGIVYNGARISLSERGHELASLRVLGFTRREIALILLGEHALLTLAAVPLGFGLGAGGAALLARTVASDLYRLPLVFSRETFAFAFLVTIAAALVSGIMVAGRIRKLDLVAVLKTRE